MKKRLIRVLSVLFMIVATVLLSRAVTAQTGYSEYLKSDIPNGYYDSVDLSKDKETIAKTLEDIMNPSDYVRIPYGSKITTLLTETDPALGQPGKVTGFYSGNAISSYNKEHVWAKSHGFGKNSSSNPYCDIHHLRPTINSINSSRSHWFFDEGGNPDGYGNNIVKNVSFEPRDEVKGDVARIIFYMATRYKTEYGLTIVDDLGDTNSTDPTMGQLSTLLKWNYSDPVSASEIHRNEAIYGIQHNRNAFIDHPEYVDYLYPNEYSNSFDQANVDAVVAEIASLPSTVTLDSKDAINLANNNYNALSKKEKEAVTNYTILKEKTDTLNVLIEAAKPAYEKLSNIDTKNSLSLTYIEDKSKYSLRDASYNFVVENLDQSIIDLVNKDAKLSFVYSTQEELPSTKDYKSIEEYLNSSSSLNNIEVSSSDIKNVGDTYTVTSSLKLKDSDGLQLRNFNKDFNGFLVFEYNDTLYSTKTKTNSFKGLVKEYLTDYRTNSVVKSHLGLLNHVKDIKIPVTKEEMEAALVNPFSLSYTENASVSLSTLVKDTKVTYTSNSENIIISGDTATIKAVSEAENATVTATYKTGNKTYSIDFNVNLRVKGAYDSFEEFSAASDGVEFTLEGVVQSITDPYSSQYGNMSVTVKVGVGETIFYHCSLTEEQSKLVKIGSTVVVRGDKYTYKGTEEIKNGVFINIDGINLEDENPTNPTEPTNPETPNTDALALVTVDGLTASYSGVLGNISVTKGQKYDQKYEVGLYLLVFKEFPPNYYTKSEIEDHENENMATVGGDVFGNKEGLLPLGQTYYESDIDNWQASSRGTKRICVTQDFTHAYYTGDHYDSFTEILFNK